MLRFQCPLIKPDVRISSIRLSDKASCFGTRTVAYNPFQLNQSQLVVEFALSADKIKSILEARWVELESSLISERVKAGMEAARAQGKRLGRPPTTPYIVSHIEELASTTTLSIRQIRHQLDASISKFAVGEIVKRVRNPS